MMIQRRNHSDRPVADCGTILAPMRWALFAVAVVIFIAVRSVRAADCDVFVECMQGGWCDDSSPEENGGSTLICEHGDGVDYSVISDVSDPLTLEVLGASSANFYLECHGADWAIYYSLFGGPLPFDFAPNVVRLICHGTIAWEHTFQQVPATSYPQFCGPPVRLCDSPDAPPIEVCPGTILCLKAQGACQNLGNGWTVWPPERATILSQSGDTVQVQIHGPGEVSVYTWCEDWQIPDFPLVDCETAYNGASYWAYFNAISCTVDLDIDSMNMAGFDEHFDRSGTVEEYENDPEMPGKIIFVNNVDDDGDNVPGFADGISEKWDGSGGSEAWFVPMKLQLQNPQMAKVVFTYSAAPPVEVHKVPADGTYQSGSTGRLRLWTADGNVIRSTIETELDPNVPHFIRSGTDAQHPQGYSLSELHLAPDPDGNFTIWVEAVNPSASAGSDTIHVAVVWYDPAHPTVPETMAADQVRVTSSKVEIHDLRAWGPLLNPDGSAGIVLPLSDHRVAPVDGAITDGASICLVRMEPTIQFTTTTRIKVQAVLTGMTGNASTDPGRVGTLYPMAANNSNVLPEIPTQWPLTPDERSNADMAVGRVFYVPPESFNVSATPGAGETTPIEFQVAINDLVQGKIPFLLRRPPIVLVHGIMSSPQTWVPTLWGESPTSPFQTRIYPASWATTNTKGYSENYRLIAMQIEAALEDYRTANDHGHDSFVGFHGLKFAATRADVVGHSQGGQITRFYIANGMLAGFDRSGWSIDHYNGRTETSPTGAWPYLRNMNFGVGSIRRFITLGSPFKGSPWADLASLFLADGDGGPTPAVPAHPLHQALLNAIAFNQIDPMTLQMIYDSINETYLPPTCVADLSQNSNAQVALEAAQYPPGTKRIRWFPIVGIATQTPGEAPVQSTLMQLLINLAPVESFPGAYSPLHFSMSDLIVPACSQRNLATDCGDPSNPILPGEIFTNTSHSATSLIPKSETESVPIRDRVAQLLSGYPSPFSPSWSLGP